MSKVTVGKNFLEHKVFKAKEREDLAEKGQAMPGGGFPIRNESDLKNAIQAFGRAKNKAAAKAWIIKRAKALGLTDLLPEDWVEHSALIDRVLSHHGVKGMRWGVRRSRKQLARSAGAQKRKSVKDLSDEELRKAVNRMNMEQQYTRLSSGKSSGGNKKAVAIGAGFIGGIGANILRTQLTNAGNAQVNRAISARAAKAAAKKAVSG